MDELQQIKAAQVVIDKEDKAREENQFGQMLGDAQYAENTVFDDIVDDMADPRDSRKVGQTAGGGTAVARTGEPIRSDPRQSVKI